MSQAHQPKSSDGHSQGKGHSGLRHTMFIVGAIVLAVIFAVIFPKAAAALHLGGDFFLRVLMMIVVPLVMASVMSGILGLGDVRKLGRPGAAIQAGELVSVFKSLSSFIITVLLGLGIHALGTLPLIYWIFTRKNPYRFMLQMSQALLTAFSTSNSSATLPVTMETAVDEAGISRQSAEFVLPLGATAAGSKAVTVDGCFLRGPLRLPFAC